MEVEVGQKRDDGVHLRGIIGEFYIFFTAAVIKLVAVDSYVPSALSLCQSICLYRPVSQCLPVFVLLTDLLYMNLQPCPF